ncbi:MAG: DoxX family protein [Leptospiraceae bacterium]
MDNVIKKVLPVAGRAMIAAMAVFFGLGHLTGADQMVGAVPIPGGVIWVYFTGVCLIAGGVGLFIPKVAKLAGALLGLLILIFALTIHAPKMAGGDQGAMMNFFKDLAIAGGAWLAAVISDMKGQ